MNRWSGFLRRRNLATATGRSCRRPRSSGRGLRGTGHVAVDRALYCLLRGRALVGLPETEGCWPWSAVAPRLVPCNHFRHGVRAVVGDPDAGPVEGNPVREGACVVVDFCAVGRMFNAAETWLGLLVGDAGDQEISRGVGLRGAGRVAVHGALYCLLRGRVLVGLPETEGCWPWPAVARRLVACNHF